MKISKTLFLLFIIPFFLISCFDFIEEIQLHADGSGKASYKLNLSKSKTKLSSVMLLDSIKGYAIPSKEQVHIKFEEIKRDLSSQPGIHEVKLIENWVDYIFQISFEFDSISSLNKGFESLAQKEERAMKYFFNPFNLNGNEFTRNYQISDYSEIEKIRKNNFEGLKEANYICIYKFDRSVLEQNNPSYKTSKNSKAVMFRSTLLDLIDQKSTLQNTVTFK